MGGQVSNCTTGCLTQDHASYAACLKGKSIRVMYANSANGLDLTTEKKWDKELTAYADARAAGIQPETTKLSSVREANELSDVAGKAYQADTKTFV